MQIALIDPFFDQSHKLWAEGLKQHSTHTIDIYQGSAHNWKWKMTGGTIPMARQINNSKIDYDLFLVTDMLNLPLFKALLSPKYQLIPFALYFHENQITYPWSPTDSDIKEKRDHHYGFINYCSALIAKNIFFNSAYHKKSFLTALPQFLKRFPEEPFAENITEIDNKSSVLPLGLDLPPYKQSKDVLPVFLWNHRWEYDKNPDLFFNTLFQLKKAGIDFKLIVMGQSYKRSPKIFREAKERLNQEIIHFGYVESKEQYWDLIQLANILLITSHQDFFGISIVEAIASGCYPILPDRLSYREHVSATKQTNVIYSSDKDCFHLCAKVIKKNKYSNCKETSEYVSKYDWTNVVRSYNDVLASM